MENTDSDSSINTPIDSYMRRVKRLDAETPVLLRSTRLRIIRRWERKRERDDYNGHKTRWQAGRRAEGAKSTRSSLAQ